MYVYTNGSEKIYSTSNSAASDWGNLSIYTTLKVAQGDKVEVRFHGRLSGASDLRKTHIEGRLISILNE